MFMIYVPLSVIMISSSPNFAIQCSYSVGVSLTKVTMVYMVEIMCKFIYFYHFIQTSI